MRFERKDPPRVFSVGRGGMPIHIKDCGRVELEPDEQLTFVTSSGAEYDVVRKLWGFYATPSLNGRLKRFGLRGVLVRNTLGQYFVLLLEQGHELAFDRYVRDERLAIVCWLDSGEALERLCGGIEAV